MNELIAIIVFVNYVPVGNMVWGLSQDDPYHLGTFVATVSNFAIHHKVAIVDLPTHSVINFMIIVNHFSLNL